MKVISKTINPAAPAAPLKTMQIKMKTMSPSAQDSQLVASRTPAVTPPVASEQGLETPDVETTPEATQALSPQYSALAKRERALRKLDDEFKQREASFKAQQGNLISLDDLKKDPFAALNKAGVTYDQLTQQPAADSPESALQAKIEALEARLSTFDKRIEDRDSESYKQAIKVIESDATLLVNSDPAYETIKAQGKTKEVVSLIEKIFETEGTILDVTEAAQLVEDALVEQSTKQYEMLGKLKKVQAKLTPPPATLEQQSISKQPGKTLTNAMGVQRPLSARERAILAFNNKLK